MNVDSAGLLKILEKHGAELHALLTRLTLRADVAEDLLQELFLKLGKAKGFACAINPKAYLFRAAIHLAFDWRSLPTAEPLLVDPASLVIEPLDSLIDAEELELVLDAMQSLSKLGRHIVVLKYLQHQEYPEIAAHVGKTEHQVRALCAKAIGQLRTMLKPVTNLD